MANENNNNPVSINYLVPALLTLLALAGTLGGWQSSFLNSVRPTVDLHRPSDIGREQNVEARLWQDPIAAVEQARGAAGSGGGAPGRGDQAAFSPLCSTQMQNSLGECVRDFKKNNELVPGIKVLLAMVPGGMYAEEAEARLRMREAVVAALSAGGYRAKDEERIGAWQLAWPRRVELEGYDKLVKPDRSAPTADVFLPFERYEMRRNISRNHSGPDNALVIWLPDSLFDDEPLTRLAQLVELLESWNLPLHLDILGPSGSSMLRKMLPWQLNPPRPSCEPIKDAKYPSLFNGVRMFSWSATAMDDLLVHFWQGSESRVEIRNYFKQEYGLDFVSTIATDDQLSAELVDELKLRGVDLAGDKDHAALLYEWDTFYGRTLPLSFAAEVRRRQDPTLSHEVDEATCKRKAVAEVLTSPELAGAISRATPNLHVFTYLRGIDGKLAKEPERKDTLPVRSSAAPSSDQKKENNQELNRAEGQNQLDYIPRVALEVERLTRDLRGGALGEPGALKAIGLMGSDFYDKLLILQALQPHFPDAIFFTTDLDGRFLDPQFARWTRNLVVASSFGLTLRREIQRDAPPFRGCYQTSLFYATLCALGSIDEGQMRRPPAVRRFEIGRVRAVDLSTTPDPVGIQPEAQRSVHPRQVLCWLLLAALAGWLLVIFSPPWRNTFKPFERNHARARAILFREKDILSPLKVVESVKARISPLIEAEPTKKSRAEVARWLNQLMLGAGFPQEKVSDRDIRLLTGQPAPWQYQWAGLLPLWSRRRYNKEARKTKRLAARRLLLERWLKGQVETCHERSRVLNQKLSGAFFGVGATVAAMLVLLVCAMRSHVDRAGEPFSFTEGISIWPCEIFRLAAFLLTITFACVARLHLRTDEALISEEFHLRRRDRISFRRFWNYWRRLWHKRHPATHLLLAPITIAWALRERYPAIGWRSLEQTVVAERLWRDYRRRSKVIPRLLRSGAHLVLYVVFCLLIVAVSGREMFVPARGSIAQGLDKVLLELTVVAFLYLNFLVADAARLARTFILLMTKGPTAWPNVTRSQVVHGGERDPSAPPVEWLDVQFIGQLTKKVTLLVYYPAVILCLLIIARTRYFDDWSWPLPLVVIFALNSLWPILSAFLLQTAARQARAEALASLEDKLAVVRGGPDEEKRVAFFSRFLEQIKQTREGAFADYFDNPALKALLLPFTGAGLVNLVNFLTTN